MGDSLCKQVNCDALGISIQIVSTFLAALAYVLQKKAHLRVQALAGDDKAAGVGGATAPAGGGGESGEALVEGWSASLRGRRGPRARARRARRHLRPPFLLSPRSRQLRQAPGGSGAGGSA